MQAKWPLCCISQIELEKLLLDSIPQMVSQKILTAFQFQSYRKPAMQFSMDGCSYLSKK